MDKLELVGIYKSYEGVPVLNDINISLSKGELVSIVGASGAGKSTLFNIVSGLQEPTRGEVLLDGEDIRGKTGLVSYMLQKDLLLPYRTVEDNIALPLLLRGESKERARELVGERLERFGLEGKGALYPKQISGGMRQRAALLRTYFFSGDLLLLDEPFSALDTLTRADMHTWFLEVFEDMGAGALFITHDIDEALLLSDRVYVLTGKPGEIKGEIKIETKGRKSREFLLSAEFIEYKRRILDYLG